jgi:hypothetical protein
VPKRCRYKRADGDPTYPQYFPRPNDLHGYISPGDAISALQGNFCKMLQIRPGSTVVKQDVVLEPAAAMEVKIRDAGGRPLRGTWVASIDGGNWLSQFGIWTDSCTAYGVEAGKPRLMVCYHPGRNLAGTLVVTGKENGSLAMRLGPAGVARGRLLAADGKPLADVVVEVAYHAEAAACVHRAVRWAKHVVTDARGAFVIDELVPAVPFTLYQHRANRAGERAQRIADETSKVEATGELDLGDIKIRSRVSETGE